MTKKSRNTRQKELIIKIISKHLGFFNAEDIFKLVQKEDSRIGIATIYRVLKDLKNKNKNKIYYYTCNRKSLYSNKKISHCHYICDKTGKISHFEIDSLDFLDNIKNKIPGTITSFQLEIHGICEKCE